MKKPSLKQLTALYFRVGNTTFGGGTPTIAALQRELIDREGWITQEDYALAYAIARVTPGTNILAFCAATGARILGFAGAVAALLAVTLPSAVLAVFLTQGYEAWRTNPIAIAVIAAMVAAVAGMMWASIWSLLKPHFQGFSVRTLRTILFAGGAFLAAWRFGVTPLPIIAVGALAGFIWADKE